MLNLDFLQIYKTEHQKIRIGDDKDGGYVIIDGFDYDLLLSCGISNDTSFENNFLNIHKNTTCYAFDGTIDNLPSDTNKNVVFIKKNISKDNNEKETNMFEIINNNENIFLKMDIETWEYDWLNIIDEKILNKFKQIVIEFHFPFTYSEDIFKKFSYPMDVTSKLECLQKLSKTHYLVHLHGNNNCGTINYENLILPNVFECTYLRKDLCNKCDLTNEKIPNLLLDKPNIINKPDIELSGYPFTR